MYERDRLKALVHYVIWKVGAHPDFGATKLNKIAWFSDARSYVLTGKSITGAPYTRQEHGPVPRDVMIVRGELAAEGMISQLLLKQRHYEHWQFKALQHPVSGVFSEGELKEINYWSTFIVHEHTAESVSELSHDFGWEIAAMGERLPFISVLAQRVREPNAKELEWAKSKAKELGLT
ncbi:Panacea domain-containing protein [Aminobacter sp. SS-2016]|uniref:Panacea domain-containing protein n=1 Tax=Aminobacter sp. Y103A TaxID=1870862 RepID=UPI0025739092|nr:Panacea domain-containing protein [Aminobacter sp. SS-2016]